MNTYAEAVGSFTPGEIEQLFLTIESSLQIHRRYQFYVWAQSRLYALIPHDVLICAHHDPARKGMQFDCFSMFPLPKPALDGAYQPGTGLMPRIVELWQEAQGTPCSLEQAAAAGVRQGPLIEELRTLDFGEFLAHGMASAYEERPPDTFFGFFRVSDGLVPEHIKRDVRPITPRHSFMLEIILPYLHVTYQRIVAVERRREPRRTSATNDTAVTGREIEILGWVREGKSNKEIGMLLCISPLTVKNHVQKILRKLGATNRAQAVSKALAQRVLVNLSRSSEDRPA